ncbi:ABC transporter ATP-binding protein/permease [Blautia pseudococcoides]|nr:ABC transporter ATP-binding protein/permease [Blautia pseudococcoides]
MTRLKFIELKRTLNFMSHKKLYIACILISCFSYAAYQIITSFVNMFLINSIIEENLKQLELSFVLLIVALIISVIIDPYVTYNFNQCINTTVLKLRTQMFTKIESLNNSQVIKYTSGDLLARITEDISTVEQLFGREAYVLITAIIYGIGSSVSMFLLNWRFSVIIFIMAIGSAFASFYYGPKIHGLSTQVQQKYAVLNQIIIDTILGSKTIKIYNAYNYLSNKYRSENKNLIQAEMDKNIINSKINVINFFLNTLNIIGAFSIGALMVAKGLADFGTILAVIGLQKGIVFMFERVGKYYIMIQSSLAAASRLFEILDLNCCLINKLEEKLVDKNLEKKINENIILFEKVSFAYIDEKYVIKDLYLNIQKNDIILISGASGNGKSTLLKLILGFYFANMGQIYVGGKKVNEKNAKQIRDQISYVSQDAFLFAQTIEQNIICNVNVCKHEEIVNAAKKANAHDFIMSLPDGYETLICENGSNLSNGQRQRIAIARAFLKNAPIILLDEPTASLDAESERKVKEALEKLCNEKTVILIGHEQSILKTYTKEYRLCQGTLIEV